MPECMPMGVDRLKALVEAKFLKHSHQKGKANAGPSPVVLRRVFSQYDTDGNGTIGVSEFSAMLTDLGILNVAASDKAALFELYDVDRSGTIDYAELCGKFIQDVDGVAASRGNMEDFPSAMNLNTTKYQTDEEKLHRLQTDAWTKWLYDKLTVEAFAAMCGADQSGMAMRSNLDAVVTSKLVIGIGNAEALSNVILQSSNGDFVNIPFFLQMLLPGLDSHDPNSPHSPKRGMTTKFTRRQSCFDKPAIGVDRLKELVDVKFYAHSHAQGNAKAVSSANTLRKVFSQFDTNGDGTIDNAEFTAMLLALGIRDVAQTDVDGLFAQYDTDHSGGLAYGEFTNAWFSGNQYQAGVVNTNPAAGSRQQPGGGVTFADDMYQTTAGASFASPSDVGPVGGEGGFPSPPQQPSPSNVSPRRLKVLPQKTGFNWNG